MSPPGDLSVSGIKLACLISPILAGGVPYTLRTTCEALIYECINA